VNRSHFSAGTTNAVSTMPSGPNTRSLRNSGNVAPETLATSTPRTSEQVPYSHASPGWCSIGMRDSAAIQSSGASKACGARPSFCTLNSRSTAGSVKSGGKP
jgi:hypothetical protein